MRTGVGSARARRAALALEKDPARVLAVAGLCGALDPALCPGDLVVASELRQSHQRRQVASAHDLCAELRRFGLRAVVGSILAVDRVVRGAERKALRATGAHAIDMESAWLATAAAGRPLAVVRVVVDGPDHELLRPATLWNGLRAIRALETAAAAIEAWAGKAAIPGGDAAEAFQTLPPRPRDGTRFSLRCSGSFD
jgi:4-hydroxy-3-methylbut-2-enyl diphosphate reductase